MWAALLSNSGLAAQETASTGRTIHPQRAGKKPVIDGQLTDDVWQSEPLAREFITYDPMYGETLPVQTLIWTAYDKKNLYFAFRCLDPEAGKIKTSIVKRDKMFSDDWIGFSLDTLGNKQSAYEFYVNPNGIQGDILKSAVSGGDMAPDFVWHSAGQLIDGGYQVEVAIPLKSITFKSGKEVTMGVVFMRNLSRKGFKGSWPDVKPGQGTFNSQAILVYHKLDKTTKVELLPSVTYSRNRSRLTPDTWTDPETFTDWGIGFKYGLTSSMTLDVTVNPDFSQVESDQFQVLVNRRYPVFYSEKRPFFMEGADIFNFFTMPYGYLSHPVYTRQIVAPQWGAKLTGTIGKTSLGILSAGDEWPGQSWVGGEQNPHEGKQAFFGIARAKYSLGKDNYLGFLYSGREFAGSYNRVAGADAQYRVSKNQRLNLSVLKSWSTASDDLDSSGSDSSNVNFMYLYYTKPLALMAAIEHIGKDFAMDSAFLQRTGIDNARFWCGFSFYPNPEKLPWLKLVSPDFQIQYLYDHETKMNDAMLDAALFFLFTREAYVTLHYLGRQESWQGKTHNLTGFALDIGGQFTKWLRLDGSVYLGDNIYYEGEPSLKGSGSEITVALVLQPGKNLNQSFTYIHSDLAAGGETLYDVNIINSKTTYQFNKYFFLRAMVLYDSHSKNMVTDFLASFTFIPGTVLHVGYGGYYENRKWQHDNWLYQQGSLMEIKRSLFFKVSYLWRF